MTTAFVLGGGVAWRARGRHAAGVAEPGSGPTWSWAPRSALSTGRSSRPTRWGRRPAPAHVGGDELRLAFSERLLSRAIGWCVRVPPAFTGAAAAPAGGRPAREDFADLKLPFQCVAASIENASARWFASGRWCPGDGLVRRAGLLPRWRSTAGTISTAGLSTRSGRPAVTLGASHRLRAAGGPDRKPAGRTDAALGSGACRVRDRPAAPVSRGDVVAA